MTFASFFPYLTHSLAHSILYDLDKEMRRKEKKRNVMNLKTWYDDYFIRREKLLHRYSESESGAAKETRQSRKPASCVCVRVYWNRTFSSPCFIPPTSHLTMWLDWWDFDCKMNMTTGRFFLHFFTPPLPCEGSSSTFIYLGSLSSPPIIIKLSSSNK